MSKIKTENQLTTTPSTQPATEIPTTSITTKTKIGRTTYEVTTSFNGNKNRDIKSSLLRLMVQDAKKNTADNVAYENIAFENYSIKDTPVTNTLPKSG